MCIRDRFGTSEIMAHKGGIEALDRTLQDIRSNKNLMSGVTLLMAGDFKQTLPVVPRGTRADDVKASLKSSVLWPKVQVRSLRVNMLMHLKGRRVFKFTFTDR